jgi:hypothetical protein
MRSAQAIACALTLASIACEPAAEDFARVIQITDMSQVIGGPAAAGAIGDYLLENDKIRVIIHGRPEHTGSSTVFGGTILDADIQRSQEEYAGGNGRDALFEVAPIVSLAVAKPADRDAAGASPDITIVRAEASAEGGALLVVEGEVGNIVETIKMFGLVVPQLEVTDLFFHIQYELRPGESFLRITTDSFPGGRPDGDLEMVEATQLVGSKSLIEVIAGDLSTPCDPEGAPCPDGTSCVTALSQNVCRGSTSEVGGSFGGFLALMGAKLKLFVPGAGHDPWLSLKAAVAQDIDFMSSPVPFDFLAGVGNEVSYALFSEGDMLIPVATSAFTMAITHETQCTVGNPDCLAGKGTRMRAYFAVGEGDVASAVEPFYALREQSTATLTGTVLDARTMLPVSKAEVLVFADPWPENEQASAVAYATLANAHRRATVSALRPAGDPGLVTHLRSDVGNSPVNDGRFAGKVPVVGTQRVYLVARHGEVFSDPVAVQMIAGEVSEALVLLPQPGTIEVSVVNHDGRPIPAKVTIGRCMVECATDADCGTGRVCEMSDRRCVSSEPCAADNACDPDETCNPTSGACECDRTGVLPRELGGHWQVDGVYTAQYVGQGGRSIELPAGVYERVISRGIEYDLDRDYVTVLPGRTTRVLGHLNRVVDTTGFISADFHVHGSNSPDSGVLPDSRVMSFAGEGVELLTATDHDVFTDYLPAIKANGLDRFLRTQSGVESSPLMMSHFLGFPVAIDDGEPLNMPRANAFDWSGNDPRSIMDAIRKAGVLGGGGDAVVLLAHVYDYFNYYKVNSYTLVPEGSFLYFAADPLLNPALFSAAMDGFEVANGKSYDFIRKPTVQELTDYNFGLQVLTAQLASGDIDLEGYSDAHQELGRSTVVALLTRTEAEQSAFIDASAGVDCSCLGAADCAADEGPAEAPCDGYRGVMDDWMRLANYGLFPTGVANSDSHDLYHLEAGMPRNYVASATDQPQKMDLEEVNRAVQRGEIVGTYGPFIRFSVEGAGPGQTVTADAGQSVTVKVQVQSPLWFDVDRLELYRNGQLWQVVDVCNTGGDQGGACFRLPNVAIVNLDTTFTDAPEVDTWYSVIVMGVSGKTLAPVYSTQPLARLGFNETVSQLSGLLPAISLGGGPITPSVHPTIPYAFTNPVRVIVDGDGVFNGVQGAPPAVWQDAP